MGASSIENLLSTSMLRLREMIDVDTIIGKPLDAGNGTVVIPVSKVCCGYGCGGWDKGEKTEKTDNNSDSTNFAGGGGGGVSVEPVAFLVITPESVRLIEIDDVNPYAALAEKVPEIISTIGKLFKKDAPAGDGK